MNKIPAIILAIILTTLILSNFYLIKFYQESRPIERETVVVKRVIDGDTLELNDGRKLRLLNVNSPEKNTLGYKESLDFMSFLENSTVEIEKLEEDLYDRILSRVYHNKLYINLELVRQGYASKFLVHKRELKKFSDAESFAIKNSIGNWRKSGYYGCFRTEIDEQLEKVEIFNECNISLNSWILKDESRKSYSFSNKSFNKITLHSSQGEDNSTDIFWNSKTNIWNNDRDSLYLFDDSGSISHYYSYGY